MGEILSSIGQVIEMGLRAAFYSIGSFVYQAIIYMYNLFEKLCNGRFLDSELLESFSERIGLILGLLMLFIVIFSMIKMVLDPDKITDKEMGASSLIKKLVIVIVMLGTSGFVFDALYTVQKLIIENNVISKLLLPVQLDDKTSENFGAILSEELLFAFYHVNEFNGEPPADVSKCESVVNNLRNDIILYQDFALGKVCLNTTTKVNVDGEDTDMYIINYNWIFSVGVGCVVLYLLFMYCISIGTRMIQLMFLEIIAPMAIVSYVLPKKDTMFSKWTKMYIATYIDVFIRIAIINFIVFIISTLFVTDGAGFAIFWDSIGGKPTGAEHKFILVIIIIALLTFAKKAPDLLKDLFPAGASKLGFSPSMKNAFGLGALLGGGAALGVNAVSTLARSGKALGWDGNKSFRENLKNLKNINPASKEGRNMLKAAGKTAVGGMLFGGAASLIRGGKAGVNGKNVLDAVKSGQQTQAKANIASAQRAVSGVGTKQYLSDKAREAFGIQTGYQEYDKRVSENQAVIDAVNNAKSVKALTDQLGNVKENIAIKRNDTELKFLADMKSKGLDGTALVKQLEMENYMQTEEFKNKSSEEQGEYRLEHSKVVAKNDQSLIDSAALSLVADYKNQNAVYDEAIKRATKKADNMADAVFYLTTGNIEALEKIDGVNKTPVYDDKGNIKKYKYDIDGTEVTNWGSIGATIESYIERHKVEHESLGDFKDENGKLREEAARVAHRKSGS